MGGRYGREFYRIYCGGIVDWSYRSQLRRGVPKAYKLDTKIIFRGNPVEGETISGGTIGDILETKCGKK